MLANACFGRGFHRERICGKEYRFAVSRTDFRQLTKTNAYPARMHGTLLLNACGGESGKWCLRKTRNGKRAKKKNGKKKNGKPTIDFLLFSYAFIPQVFCSLNISNERL